MVLARPTLAGTRRLKRPSSHNSSMLVGPSYLMIAGASTRMPAAACCPRFSVFATDLNADCKASAGMQGNPLWSHSPPYHSMRPISIWSDSVFGRFAVSLARLLVIGSSGSDRREQCISNGRVPGSRSGIFSAFIEPAPCASGRTTARRPSGGVRRHAAGRSMRIGERAEMM